MNRRGFFRLLASVPVAIAAKSAVSVPSYTSGGALRSCSFGPGIFVRIHGSEAVIPRHNVASGITVRFDADMRQFERALRDARANLATCGTRKAL